MIHHLEYSKEYFTPKKNIVKPHLGTCCIKNRRPQVNSIASYIGGKLDNGPAIKTDKKTALTTEEGKYNLYFLYFKF